MTRVSSRRVALLTDSDVFAGTERHILDLALGLRELGAAPTLSAPAGAILEVKAQHNALPWLPIAKGGALDLPAIGLLRRALRRGDFEVLHAHNGRTQLSATLAAMLARRGAVVFTQHFIEPHHTRHGGLKAATFERIHRWVNARTHRFIAISGAVRDAMLGRGDADAARIEVVFNGIEDLASSAFAPREVVRQQYQIPADAPLAVCVARLAVEKDHQSLLEAFALVRRALPRARLILAGEGALKSELQRQIEALHLGEAVQLLGFVAEVPALIAAADLLVLAAPREPFGLVFLEAMTLGVAIVACQGGAAPEIVVDGQTGRLCAPHSPSELHRALEWMLCHPREACEMGRAGRERFETHFRREMMAERTLATYEMALRAAEGR